MPPELAPAIAQQPGTAAAPLGPTAVLEPASWLPRVARCSFHARRAVFAASLAPVASGLVPAVSAPVQIFAGQAASVANLVRLSAVPTDL